MDQQGMDSLYGNYRQQYYKKIRRNWEPWYRDSVNDATAPGTATTANRIAFLEHLLDQFEVGPLNFVVDFGGDMGQFFPARARRKCLIDPSERSLVDGVARVDSWAELPQAPDLVIAAHVLEHVNDPAGLLMEIRQAIPPGGYLYVEVPQDAPRLRSWHASKLYGSWIEQLTRYRWTIILLDFYTGVYRNFGFRVPRLGLVKQSEHVNYFTREGLEGLLTSTGFRVIGSQRDGDFRAGGLKMGRLGILAKAA